MTSEALLSLLSHYGKNLDHDSDDELYYPNTYGNIAPQVGLLRGLLGSGVITGIQLSVHLRRKHDCYDSEREATATNGRDNRLHEMIRNIWPRAAWGHLP